MSNAAARPAPVVAPGTIRDWPDDERPREKLLARGGEALSDAELLALFVGSGTRGRTAVDVGRALIAQYGSLGRVLELPAEEMARLPGLGAARACRIKAALEVGTRYLRCSATRGEQLHTGRGLAAFFTARLRGETQEVLACAFLDARHRLIAYEPLFRGTVDSTTIYPRELLRRCLQHNAVAVVMAHNHPSGSTEPSRADRDMTRRLRTALAGIDVELVDHLIIGDGPPMSFARRGLL